MCNTHAERVVLHYSNNLMNTIGRNFRLGDGSLRTPSDWCKQGKHQLPAYSLLLENNAFRVSYGLPKKAAVEDSQAAHTKQISTKLFYVSCYPVA
jgi:hypothetical protein